MTFEAFDVVRVPFPFTDRNSQKRRPALVLSSYAVFNAVAGHSVMAMITSSSHMQWPLDCPIQNLDAAGLPAESIVRFKLFTLDHDIVIGKIGSLSQDDAKQVANNLSLLLQASVERSK